MVATLSLSIASPLRHPLILRLYPFIPFHSSRQTGPLAQRILENPSFLVPPAAKSTRRINCATPLLYSYQRSLLDSISCSRISARSSSSSHTSRPLHIVNMIIPVRCFSCGKVIGDKWNAYLALLLDGRTEGEALTELDLKRYCCRRMVLTHVDLIEKLLHYNSEYIASLSYAKRKSVTDIILAHLLPRPFPATVHERRTQA